VQSVHLLVGGHASRPSPIQWEFGRKYPRHCLYRPGLEGNPRTKKFTTPARSIARLCAVPRDGPDLAEKKVRCAALFVILPAAFHPRMLLSGSVLVQSTRA